MRTVSAYEKKGPWHDAGALLSWGAIALSAAAQLWGEPLTVVCGLVFFLAGLAHGAGDENDGAMRPYALVHVAAYLVVGIATAALFIVSPVAGLGVFLALSAWHFARSDVAMDRISRVAIAFLAIGGSALLRPSRTDLAFGTITSGQAPAVFTDILAAFGAAGGSLALVSLVMGRSGAGHAFIALIACAFLDPILAVGLIFLVAHAIPIQQRQIASYSAYAVWRAVAWPTAVALAGASIIAAATWLGFIDLSLAIALAFGMATPHMLTERLER